MILIRSMMSLRWTLLRKVGTNRVLRTSYSWLLFVPLAAKALANVKRQVELTIFDDIFHLTIELPFSWQIFYYSAIFFSIAGIIYSWCCPAIVKRYVTFPEFFEDGRGLPYLKATTAQSSSLGMAPFDSSPACRKEETQS